MSIAPDPEISFGIPGEDRDRLAGAESDAAYRWAAEVIADRDVLVIGSGHGHGAALLAEAGARSVLGIDPDQRANEAAMRLYGERLRFIEAEPVALPLARSSFGAVTCFDALEDALDPDAALAEFRRVLDEDGVLLLSLPVAALGEAPGPARRPLEEWRELLEGGFAHVALFRRRVALAATVAPIGADGVATIDRAAWVASDPAEDHSVLAVASATELPELASVASMVSFRDLRAQHETLAAWEQRARRAEADGSAKHWELVASREAQRRLRKRLYELEHKPLRVLSRILRGKPRKLGLGPPIRASEREPDRWD